MTKILAFAGSSRTDSFNKKLIAIAAQGARDVGADVTLIDLRDFPMPLFDQDYEDQQGMPEFAREFKNHLVESDGMLISSPEYNSSYSALLKNSIDWASRAEFEGEKPLNAFAGKCVSLMATSPGGLGGIRGLVSLRMLLGNLGMIVLPKQIVVSNASNAFDLHNQLTDQKKQNAVKNLGQTLFETMTNFSV